MLKLTACVALLAVAGCSSLAPPAVSDFSTCAAALEAVGTTKIVTLLRVAATTPACQSLAADAIQLLVQQVSAKQASRGIHE